MSDNLILPLIAMPARKFPGIRWKQVGILFYFKNKGWIIAFSSQKLGWLVNLASYVFSNCRGF